MKRLERRYARLAILRDRRLERGRVRAADRLRPEFNAIRAALRGQPDGGRAAFMRLIEHKRVSVQKQAACDLLFLDAETAKAKLRQIVQRRDGSIAAMSARTALLFFETDIMANPFAENGEASVH